MNQAPRNPPIWTLRRGVSWPIWLKLALCAGCDAWDFTFGRLAIGFSLGAEGAGLVGLIFLWGPLGVLAAWEMLDLTEQFDAFIPSNLLIGLGVWLGASGRKRSQSIAESR